VLEGEPRKHPRLPVGSPLVGGRRFKARGRFTSWTMVFRGLCAPAHRVKIRTILAHELERPFQISYARPATGGIAHRDVHQPGNAVKDEASLSLVRRPGSRESRRGDHRSRK
jgi:hypothetical protein